ncbi:MAG: DUF368 domain-containing protein [Promicromonosporaceae bacterium]|nr:DUF368 domain-containing protein [Promicromonosporaceae bacterium]
MDWFIRVVKGAIMALGFILPGLSGGVLAAILGLYERIIRFLAHLRERFRVDFPFFIPIGIGGVLGLVLLSRPLGWAYENFQVAVLWGFAGVIVGTIPALWRTAAEQTARSGSDWAWLLGSLIVSLGGFFALREASGNVPANFVGFLLAGAIIGLSVLIPGLSTSNLLIILGLYHPMLDGFALNDGVTQSVVHVFLPIALGAVIILPLFSKVVELAIDRAHSRFYHVIIGLVLASTIMILVPLMREATPDDEAIVYAGVSAGQFAVAGVLVVLGLGLGLLMGHLEGKHKQAAVAAGVPDDGHG